jgi:hypothetical protein
MGYICSSFITSCRPRSSAFQHLLLLGGTGKSVGDRLGGRVDGVRSLVHVGVGRVASLLGGGLGGVGLEHASGLVGHTGGVLASLVGGGLSNVSMIVDCESAMMITDLGGLGGNRLGNLRGEVFAAEDGVSMCLGRG